MRRIGAICTGFALALTIGGCNPANEMMGPAIVGSGPVRHDLRRLDPFSKIVVSDAIQADISIGQPPSATVTAPNSLLSGAVPVVETRVEGDTLYVDFSRRATVTGTIKVRIVAPSLDSVKAEGAAVVSVNDIDSKAFEGSFNGASVVKLVGHLGSGHIVASGASHVNVSGVAEDISLSASGASAVDATNVQAKSAALEASGASTIDCGAADEIKPNASGASSIHYLGNPKVTDSVSDDASSIAHG